MTETNARKNLVNFWKNANFKKNLNIHEDDYEYMMQNTNFKFSESKVDQNKYVIHAELLPEQYIGNLSNAKIYTIMLNPGFSETDIKSLSNKKFKKCVLSTLSQENMDDYPFYMLNPEFSTLSGPGWWRKKLSFLYETIGREKKLNEKEALSFLSRNICNIELFPYHSKRFSMNYEQIRELPSVQKVTDFVKYNLVPRAERGEILVLFVRSSEIWQHEILDIKDEYRYLKFIPSSYAQCAPIFPRRVKEDSPFGKTNLMIEELLGIK